MTFPNFSLPKNKVEQMFGFLENFVILIYKLNCAACLHTICSRDEKRKGAFHNAPSRKPNLEQLNLEMLFDFSPTCVVE